MKMLNILVYVLLLSVGVQFASGIRCFDCTSENNTMCLDPSSYDQDTLSRFLVFTECGQGVIPQHRYFCRKIVQTVYRRDREAEFRITRGCGWVRAPAHLDCYKADSDTHLETVCQCFEDGCNGSNRLVANWVLLVGSTVMMINKWR